MCNKRVSLNSADVINSLKIKFEKRIEGDAVRTYSNYKNRTSIKSILQNAKTNILVLDQSCKTKAINPFTFTMKRTATG